MRLPIRSTLGVYLSLPLSCFAFSIMHGTVPVQLGGFVSSQGDAQNINVPGLRGDQYTVSNHNPTNGLFGIGYFVDGLDKDRFHLSYGVNGFYLGKTSVSGTIIQEHLYSNLAYHYDITQIPVYLDAKAAIKNKNEKYNIMLDAGVGPNFRRAGHYSETPLNSFSLPRNNFTDHSNVAFTASAGIGLRLNNMFDKAPLECGYRFFYLGQGQLQKNNNLQLNTLKTGNTYANALMCSVTV